MAYIKGNKILFSGNINMSDAILKDKTITENGTYDASEDGVDGYSSVTVNVDGREYDIEQTILEDGTCALNIVNQDAVSYIKYQLTLEKSGTGTSFLTISNETEAFYEVGEEITISATLGSNNTVSFKGWYEGDTLISNDLTFVYIMPSYDVTLTAKVNSSTGGNYAS